jgi:lipopolysaccharide transport system permease protein
VHLNVVFLDSRAAGKTEQRIFVARAYVTVNVPSKNIRRFVLLLLALVSRDITARYRRSLLGPLWAILQPLILMVLFTLLRGIVSIPSDGIPYVLFSYAALVPWTFFTNALSFCGPSVVLNGPIIKKIALPREVFPLAAVTTALFDLIMAGLVLVGMMVWFRVPVGWSLLWTPVLILLIAALAFGVGMFIASLGTFRLDFIIATPFLTQFWLYATPVMYPLSSVPDHWQTLYMLNPMVGIIEGFRSILLQNAPPPLAALGWSVLMTIVILAITWPLFRWFSRYFADVV